MFKYLLKLDKKTRHSMLRYLLPPVRLRMMQKSILFLSLTRACDAKCLMCYRNSMENYTSEHMTKENIEQLVETWGPYVDQINFGIAKHPVLNNAEPFNPEAIAESNLSKQYQGQFFDEEPSRTPYCGYAMKGAVIQPNGDVLPCCSDYANRLVMGNINNLPFEDIFFGKQAKNLRQEFYKGKIEQCGNCEKLYRFNDNIMDKIVQHKNYMDKLHHKIKQKSKASSF